MAEVAITLQCHTAVNLKCLARNSVARVIVSAGAVDRGCARRGEVLKSGASEIPIAGILVDSQSARQRDAVVDVETAAGAQAGTAQGYAVQRGVAAASDR